MSARNSLSLSLPPRRRKKKVKRRWWCAPLAFIGVREWESLIRWHSGLLIQVTFFFSQGGNGGGCGGGGGLLPGGRMDVRVEMGIAWCEPNVG